ncbi:cache domain-containing protein [Dictyobacter kobayashii]|uniref:Cache domain-containing protein n=1 Tax=Dictyobacter kobayashii TaxID=2014872 RepID=A0A402APQ3_9CHLR|nr:cache domain-containing protein [Dictyobacter kobayashii]GCE21097.1 hypothetical protein KDK_48970 [Dictyobacter kobayashii]
MVLSKNVLSPRRKFSLTARVSGLLVLAVVIPLIITVVASEFFLRPTLIAQANDQMGTDATSHAQAIDTLMIARLQDLQYICQYQAIQNYISGDEAYRDQARQELSVGNHLDPHYGNWTLFDASGNLLLSYPGTLDRGQDKVPVSILSRLQNHNNSLISDVHLDTRTQMAYVDMYTLILSNSRLVGFGRATFLLNDIWTAVNNENSAAPRSYAMILDGNGVRIAYTNPDKTLTTLPAPLFKAVAPLQGDIQQRVKDENLYGNTMNAVQTMPDPQLVSLQQNPNSDASFSFTPATKSEEYEAYQVKTHVVPWTYIVLRPMSTITSAADQQNLYLYVIAAVVMLLAGLVGMLVGGTITRPILSSVSSLTSSSEMLNTLASREQVTATEQKWIVESSQTALQSVQYYTEATSVAARKLDEIADDLKRNWERNDPQMVLQRLNDVLAVAQYIEKVAVHQEKSNQSLATAIRIAGQVTDQLIEGATSASAASGQLQEVIKQLRQVVGDNK